MALNLNTNVAALAARKYVATAGRDLERSNARLASGLRIATAADDAAGLAISETMRARVRSWSAARRNAADGVSLAQIAEGALGESNALLGRMRELAVQAASGTYGAADRQELDREFQELRRELDRLASSTEFNGISLLDGSLALARIKVGIDAVNTVDVSLFDARASSLGVDVLDLTTPAGAGAALAPLDAAVEAVSLGRGAIGSDLSRLRIAEQNARLSVEELSRAESRIRDADFAVELAARQRTEILMQGSVGVLRRASEQPELALELLSA